MFTATDHSWPSRVVAITAGMIVISRAPFCLKAIEACRDMVSGRYQAASTEDIPEIENEQPEELSQVELNNQNRSKDNIGFIHVV